MLLRKQKLNIGALGMVAAGLMIAGTNSVALKYATNTMDPLFYAGVRALAMGIILFLFVDNYKKILSFKMLVRLIPSVVLLVTFFSLHAVGVSQSGALKASILSLTMPVFVYLFAIILLHEPLIKRIFFGGVVTLLGGSMLIGIPVILGSPLVTSDVFLLIAYVCLAASVIHAKYLYRWLTANEVLSSRFIVSGSVLLAYVLIFMEPSVVLTGSPQAWLALLYAVVVVGVLGNTLYYRALTKVKVEQTAPLYYLDPMTGTLLATVLLGERLDLAAAIGVAVILLGVVLSYPHHPQILHKYQRRHPHRIGRMFRALLHPLR